MILAATALGMAASHTLIDGVLEQSTIYPGTVHTFQVYVPEQYDGKRPAALYVGLDGVLYSMPAADLLTAVVSAVIVFRTYKQLEQR